MNNRLKATIDSALKICVLPARVQSQSIKGNPFRV